LWCLHRRGSWHVGICVPASLLGASGYLSEKQANLESLSLTTDSACSDGKTVALELTKFHHLRAFLWRGISTRENLHSLLNVLHTNSKHLERLELGFAGRGAEFELLWAWNRFVFPSLQTLSLSHVYFIAVSPEMISALNIGVLRSVWLNHCPAVQKLLRAIIQLGQQVRFASLELTIQCKGAEDLETLDLLAAFLQSFDGLVDLYLLLCNGPQINKGFWRSVLHQQHTLRRLAYHETNLLPTFDRLVLLWETVDVSKLANFPLDLQLEALGICCSWSQLVRIDSYSANLIR
jgi:hypothetical protein